MTVSIRLSPEAEQRLDRLATQTGRSKSFYLRELIEGGLDDLEDYYLADATMVRLRKGQEKTIRVTLGRLEEGEKIAKGEAPKAAEPTVKKTLGLEVSNITDELRKRFQIKEGLKGVLIVKVDPSAAAADKRVSAGDVIIEVQQDTVATPDDLLKRVEALKKEGKKSALFLIANNQGDVRFVALPLE